MTFRALGELAGALAGIPGPKNIIWITRGAENWVHYPYGCQDVTFPLRSGSYVAGTCTSDCSKWHSGKCIDYTPFFARLGAQLNRSGTVLYSVEQVPSGALPPSDHGTSMDTLKQLTDLTGGRAYSSGDFDKALSQSIKDARARYQLAFDAPASDGKFHKLRVKCNRKDVVIEAQRGYYAVNSN